MGRLAYGAFRCFTLELPWLNNKNGESCIPAGIYRAKKYLSPTKGLVLLLIDVPGRQYIEVHSGNYTYQIEGCILVGDGVKYLDQDDIPDVTNSKVTLKQLLTVVPKEVNVEIARTLS